MPEPTADDLIGLGITSIPQAPRRPVRESPRRGRYRLGSPGIAALKPDNEDADAERRQLTVMFCDLVDSMEPATLTLSCGLIGEGRR
jgi:hypothetical protein